MEYGVNCKDEQVMQLTVLLATAQMTRNASYDAVLLIGSRSMQIWERVWKFSELQNNEVYQGITILTSASF